MDWLRFMSQLQLRHTHSCAKGDLCHLCALLKLLKTSSLLAHWVWHKSGKPESWFSFHDNGPSINSQVLRTSGHPMAWTTPFLLAMGAGRGQYRGHYPKLPCTKQKSSMDIWRQFCFSGAKENCPNAENLNGNLAGKILVEAFTAFKALWSYPHPNHLGL